jgi:pyruvate dehydrogenase E2 component (dihydrolipoamide acetyltransferase)
MPSLGADMESGTVVEWRVKPGDPVARGDIVADVETQKGVIEVEIFESGVVEELLVPKGTKVPVGTILARIHGEKEEAGEIAPRVTPTPEALPAPGPERAIETAPRVERGVPPVAPVRGVRASPAARRLAAERGVDLARLAGTGPGHVITLADVQGAEETALLAGEERAAAAAAPAPAAAAPPAPAAPIPAIPAPVAPPPAGAAPPAADRQEAMRQAIAAAVARSNREIPHYYLSTDIDTSRAIAWLQRENLTRPVPDRMLPAVLLLKSVATALRQSPELNGFWVDGAFRPSASIHLGVAISLRGGGLVAPAIHDADHRSIDELMRALRDLVQRARSGALRSSEVMDPTITVTNLGDQGVRTVFGVIYPPQVALVGFGRITERPWAEGGMVGVRPVVTATLAADHRASDGHRGALFLAAVDHLLQRPEEL